jgi:hypothetical protein
MIKKPILNEIEDEKIRAIVRNIISDVNAEPFISSQFKFIEMNILKAETNYKVRHGLGFLPKDVIVTYKSGSGTYDIKYDLFTADHIVLSTTGPVSLRMFVGRYV